jgi:transposase
VKKYYEKEIIERAFRQMKGILNLRLIRVWLKEHVKSHIKICYLAYAILALMNYRLKKLKTSSVEALYSLKYGYKVKLFDKKNNFEWDLIVPLNPKQKNILNSLGVVYKN